MIENVFQFLEKFFLAAFEILKSSIKNIRNKQTESLKTKTTKDLPKKSPEIKTIPKTQSVINLKNEKTEEKVNLSQPYMDQDNEPITKMPSTELLDRALDDGELLVRKI